jgi:hypothetical protein
MKPNHSPARSGVAFILVLLSLIVSSVPRTAAAEPADVTSSVQIFDLRVEHRTPPGWTLAHAQQNDKAMIREYLPAGQTVHAWREMITLQVLRNLAQNPRAAPDSFLALMADITRQSCPEGAMAQMTGKRRIGSVTGETAILGCRRVDKDHPSGLRRGQGELAVYLVFQSENHLLLLHRAARGPAFEADKAPIHAGNAEAMLKSMAPTRVCRIDAPDCR